MIGVDSNVLLRWIVGDGEERLQTRRAGRLFQENVVHVSVVALLEMLWVLRSRYRVSRDGLIDVVERLLATTNLRLQESAAVRIATSEHRIHGGDFPDHLLAAFDEAAGCTVTCTLDVKAARSPKFKPLSLQGD